MLLMQSQRNLRHATLHRDTAPLPTLARDVTPAYPLGMGVNRGGTLMTGKIADRIDALEQRLKQLKTQQQRLESRKRTQNARTERREELRKKVLVGAVVLAKVERGEIDENTLRAWLDGALSKAEDRALFGLPTTS